MKNENPSGRNLRFASLGQRLFSVFVFAVFAYLIWLAWTGRYDTEVNRFAAWLREHYNALTR
jgi:hypothetical protein